jgi:hypothetical protein
MRKAVVDDTDPDEILCLRITAKGFASFAIELFREGWMSEIDLNPFLELAEADAQHIPPDLIEGLQAARRKMIMANGGTMLKWFKAARRRKTVKGPLFAENQVALGGKLA